MNQESSSRSGSSHSRRGFATKTNADRSNVNLWFGRVLCIVGSFAILREVVWQEYAVLHKAVNRPISLTHKSKGFGKRKRPSSAVSMSSNESSVWTLDDLPDLKAFDIPPIDVPARSWEEAIVGREKVVEVLDRAGIRVDLDVLQLLPKWDDVKELYGGGGENSEPVVIGMETCEAFREAYSPERRHVGVSGQHNCGTNAFVKYINDNFMIPGNPGFTLGGVSWHKHSWKALRGKYFFAPPTDYESVMPVILIRDPYFWMQSMCESPYLMEWKHDAKHCPNLVSEKDRMTGVTVRTQWGAKWVRYWGSLAHVWSEWYREYFEADFPRLMIRFEDLLFYTPEVMEKIRECTGAEWKHEFFVYTTEAIKQKEYFTKIKPQSSMLSAIIKYGQDNGRRTRNMTFSDLSFASQHLDPMLMEVFRYIDPSRQRKYRSYD